jgi:hypothetical protein
VLNITELLAPTSVSYDKEGTISFMLERVSESLPSNVTVTIRHDNFEHIWTFDELTAPRIFSFTFNGRDLDLTHNVITVEARFQDALGTLSTTSQTVTVYARDFTTWQRIKITLFNIERWLEKFF